MDGLDAHAVVQAIQHCLPDEHQRWGLHEPCIEGSEWAYVKQCLDSGWVSSSGEFVDRFEKELAEFTGAAHAVATVNGTAALHLCLKLAGVAADDEVLTPALTFVATTNAVAYCGAVPHFVDCDRKTLGVDPVRLDGYLQEVCEPGDGQCVNKLTGRVVRALVVMHTFGHPADLDALKGVCEAHGIALVEDAAEALGSYYHGRHVGHDGVVGALSFNGNKIVTTGGGGAILTDDAELARQARHLSTVAKVSHPWRYEHDQIGYNYRMPNINAAMGCAQMEQLPGFLRNKRALAACYRDAFRDVSGVEFIEEAADVQGNCWLNALLLDERHSGQRDALLELAHREGLLLRPVWQLQHRLPMYRECPRMALEVAEALELRLINIPSSAALGERHAGG